MKIITKFKDRFSYPIKHQKEKIVIAITLICFLISGFSLPSIRAAYGIEPVEDTIPMATRLQTSFRPCDFLHP